MFRTLRSRLLLSYVGLILICLTLVGLGLLLFVWASPWRVGTTLLRLEVAARAVLPELPPREGVPLHRLEAALSEAAERQGIRGLLVDPSGTVRFDTEEEWEGERLQSVARALSLRGRFRGTFTSPGGGFRWLFVGQVFTTPDGGRVAALLTTQQNRLLALIWFGENLLPPLLQAGLVALLLSAVLAWLMARSVARPLRRVAAAAGAIAQGDLSKRAPVSGPQEVRDLAAAFNRMAEQVATTQQAQRDFVANVSHELKTPLTSIHGFSQAILDGTASNPEAVRRAAQIIYDEAERMRRMVEELLHLARFDAGQIEMAQAPVDLGKMLARCVERMTPQAEAAGNRLDLSVSDDLVVIGDADWLTQVFVNLLDNAIRHTRDGRIELAARRTDGWIEVSVTDTGEGIPPEDLGRIFERFYQADRSRRRKGGVGLGLPIAREVVRRHGGEITAESVVGLGSRFTVRLPAAPLAPAGREGERT